MLNYKDNHCTVQVEEVVFAVELKGELFRT